MMFDFETYLSPFTWRYGSQEMRQIWSEANKRRKWREMWVALAEVQAEYGLVSPDQLQDLKSQVADIDVPRALQIEAEIHHDLMAELKNFASRSPLGGGVLHMEATSTDIEDNADVLRVRESLDRCDFSPESLPRLPVVLWSAEEFDGDSFTRFLAHRFADEPIAAPSNRCA